MRRVVVLLLAMGLGATTAFGQGSQPKPSPVDGYHEFNYGKVDDGVEQWTQAIRVLAPELRSEVRGNVTVKPFDDARVRKALRLAIDPKVTLDLVRGTEGSPAEHHHVSPIHPAYAELPPLWIDKKHNNIPFEPNIGPVF